MPTVSATPGVQELQLLVFRVRGEECAVALTDAREIITAGTLTPVPAAPPVIRGMVNLRGRVVTIVDLAVALGLSGEATSLHIVVAERGNDVFGVLVDTVTGVLRVPANSLQHAPDLVQARHAARYVRGVIVLDPHTAPAPEALRQAETAVSKESRLIVLLDLPGLLDDVGSSRQPALPVVAPSVVSPVQP